MFRENYRNLNSHISPDERLIDITIQKVQKQQEKQHMMSFASHRPAAWIAAVCICVLVTMPVLAANVEPVYQILYAISPAAAQFFMPVHKADEDNGIRMGVVSAYIHENKAEIYLIMQDLIGERIDGTTDLYDSYSINCPFDSTASCEFLKYDGETKTASFLIRIESRGGRIVSGDKVTFSAGVFLSRKKKYENVEIPVELTSVWEAEERQKVETRGGGGSGYERYADSEGFVEALIPDEEGKEFLVDGIDLTGIGYIDGMLHIQTSVKNRIENDNHGYIYFKDENGNAIYCDCNFYFSDDKENIDYCEYVFDIPQSEIEKFGLFGDFVTAGMRTEGDWRVTFPLNEG